MVVFVLYELIDLPVLPLCVQSIGQFLEKGPHRVIVVGPALPAKLAGELQRFNAQWMDPATVLPGLTRDDMPEIPFEGHDCAGAIHQRILGWAVGARSPDDLYAVVHASLTFAAPVRVFGDNRVYLPAEGAPLPALVKTAQSLVGEIQPGGGTSRHFMIYHKVVLQQVLDQIATLYPKRHFYDAILNAIDLDQPDSFCEMNTYAWFALKAYPANVRLRPMATLVMPKDIAGLHGHNVMAARQRVGGSDAIFYQPAWLQEVDAFLEAAQEFVDLDAVEVMLDVGSRDAEVSLSAKRYLPGARLFAFECNPDAVRLCRDNLRGQAVITLVERAVSNASGTVDFYAIDPLQTATPHSDGNIGASSLFQADPSYPYERYVQQKITVQATTLKEWAQGEGVQDIDLMWMDVQGAELHALQGLGEMLQRVKVIYAEVEYKQMYQGQPLHQELQSFLEAQGFRLHRRFNTSEWFGNELFVRRDLPPRPRASHGSFVQLLRPHLLPPRLANARYKSWAPPRREARIITFGNNPG